MHVKLIRCFPIIFGAIATNVFASDWITIFETDEQLMELDRSSIEPFDGYMFARQRVTFKNPKDYKTEKGIPIKYMTLGALFSCLERTEKTSLVYKYSVDRKLVSKQEVSGLVLKALPGSISESMLKQVCTPTELKN